MSFCHYRYVTVITHCDGNDVFLSYNAKTTIIHKVVIYMNTFSKNCNCGLIRLNTILQLSLFFNEYRKTNRDNFLSLIKHLNILRQSKSKF